MAPEKFENKLKNMLNEREISPSAEAWNKLEQRLERKKSAPQRYFWWVSGAAAIALVFFLLGSYFSDPISTPTPELVEETPQDPILGRKTAEPEVLQVAASEVGETKEEASAGTASKNAIFEPPVPEVSEEEDVIASELSSAGVETEYKLASETTLVKEIQAELAAQDFPSEVSDAEIEALLLLATAELKTDSSITISASDLLHEVEFELEQSFRQKVFEVVKDGLLKAKTAVANRDF